MPTLVSLDGINTAIHNLAIKEGTLKEGFLKALQGYIPDQASLENLSSLPADELIAQIWQISDPLLLKEKRKNFSSLKSSINKSLKKLTDDGLNPEGIVIGRENIFEVSEDQKNELLQKLGVTSGEGQAFAEMFSALKEAIPGMGGSAGAEKLQQLFDELARNKKIIDQLQETVASQNHQISQLTLRGENETPRGQEGGVDGGKWNISSDKDGDEFSQDKSDETKTIDGENEVQKEESGIGDGPDTLADHLSSIESLGGEGENPGASTEGSDTGLPSGDLSDISDSGTGSSPGGEEAAGGDLEIIDEGEFDQIEIVEDEELEPEELEEEVLEEALDAGDETETHQELSSIAAQDRGDQRTGSSGEGSDTGLPNEDLSDISDSGTGRSPGGEEVAGGDFEIIDEGEFDQVEIVEDEELQPEELEEEVLEEEPRTDEEISQDNSRSSMDQEPEDSLSLEKNAPVLQEDTDVVEDVMEVDEEEVELIDEDDITIDNLEEEIEILDENEIEEIEEFEDDTPNRLIEVLSKYMDPDTAFGDRTDLLTESDDGLVAQLMDRFTPRYIKIPSGTYHIGCPNPQNNEQAFKTIQLESFYMGQFPVTNDIFDLFVRETGYQTDAERHGYGTVHQGQCMSRKDPQSGQQAMIFSRGHTARQVQGANWRNPVGPSEEYINQANHPVVQVSRKDALAFAAWAGKRLPSEAEWEAAARGQDKRPFPWGDSWSKTRCNLASAFVGTTTPVEQYGPKAASPFGICDLIGNVYEWTSSIHHRRKGGISENNSSIYILKGGSWVTNEVASISHRLLEMDSWSNIIGFRCAV